MVLTNEIQYSTASAKSLVRDCHNCNKKNDFIFLFFFLVRKNVEKQTALGNRIIFDHANVGIVPAWFLSFSF